MRASGGGTVWNEVPGTASGMRDVAGKLNFLVNFLRGDEDDDTPRNGNHTGSAMASADNSRPPTAPVLRAPGRGARVIASQGAKKIVVDRPEDDTESSADGSRASSSESQDEANHHSSSHSETDYDIENFNSHAWKARVSELMNSLNNQDESELMADTHHKLESNAKSRIAIMNDVQDIDEQRSLVADRFRNAQQKFDKDIEDTHMQMFANLSAFNTSLSGTLGDITDRRNRPKFAKAIDFSKLNLPPEKRGRRYADIDEGADSGQSEGNSAPVATKASDTRKAISQAGELLGIISAQQVQIANLDATVHVGAQKALAYQSTLAHLESNPDEDPGNLLVGAPEGMEEVLNDVVKTKMPERRASIVKDFLHGTSDTAAGGEASEAPVASESQVAEFQSADLRLEEEVEMLKAKVKDLDLGLANMQKGGAGKGPSRRELILRKSSKELEERSEDDGAGAPRIAHSDRQGSSGPGPGEKPPLKLHQQRDELKVKFDNAQTALRQMKAERLLLLESVDRAQELEAEFLPLLEPLPEEEPLSPVPSGFTMSPSLSPRSRRPSVSEPGSPRAAGRRDTSPGARAEEPREAEPQERTSGRATLAQSAALADATSKRNTSEQALLEQQRWLASAQDRLKDAGFLGAPPSSLEQGQDVIEQMQIEMSRLKTLCEQQSKQAAQAAASSLGNASPGGAATEATLASAKKSTPPQASSRDLAAKADSKAARSSSRSGGAVVVPASLSVDTSRPAAAPVPVLVVGSAAEAGLSDAPAPPLGEASSESGGLGVAELSAAPGVASVSDPSCPSVATVEVSDPIAMPPQISDATVPESTPSVALADSTDPDAAVSVDVVAAGTELSDVLSTSSAIIAVAEVSDVAAALGTVVGSSMIPGDADVPVSEAIEASPPSDTTPDAALLSVAPTPLEADGVGDSATDGIAASTEVDTSGDALLASTAASASTSGVPTPVIALTDPGMEIPCEAESSSLVPVSSEDAIPSTDTSPSVQEPPGTSGAQPNVATQPSTTIRPSSAAQPNPDTQGPRLRLGSMLPLTSSSASSATASGDESPRTRLRLGSSATASGDESPSTALRKAEEMLVAGLQGPPEVIARLLKVQHENLEFTRQITQFQEQIQTLKMEGKLAAPIEVVAPKEDSAVDKSMEQMAGLKLQVRRLQNKLKVRRKIWSTLEVPKSVRPPADGRRPSVEVEVSIEGGAVAPSTRRRPTALADALLGNVQAAVNQFAAAGYAQPDSTVAVAAGAPAQANGAPAAGTDVALPAEGMQNSTTTGKEEASVLGTFTNVRRVLQSASAFRSASPGRQFAASPPEEVREASGIGQLAAVGVRSFGQKSGGRTNRDFAPLSRSASSSQRTGRASNLLGVSGLAIGGASEDTGHRRVQPQTSGQTGTVLKSQSQSASKEALPKAEFFSVKGFGQPSVMRS